MSRIFSTGNRPIRRSSDCSVSPSTSSIEMYHQPSASPMSYTRHTFGWLTVRA